MLFHLRNVTTSKSRKGMLLLFPPVLKTYLGRGVVRVGGAHICPGVWVNKISKYTSVGMVGKRLIVFQHVTKQNIFHINTECLTLGTLHYYKLLTSKKTTTMSNKSE